MPYSFSKIVSSSDNLSVKNSQSFFFKVYDIIYFNISRKLIFFNQTCYPFDFFIYNNFFIYNIDIQVKAYTKSISRFPFLTT